MAVDSAQVSKIEIICKKENRVPIILERQNNSWIGTRGETTSQIDHASVNALLDQIDNIPVKRVAALNSDRWTDFEITDSLANVVRAYVGDQKVIDLLVGNFNYQPQPQSVTTFVREPGEDIVYGIDGLLSVNIDRSFLTFRNRGFLSFAAENIQTISLQGQEG
ncbi:MAG: DUF4340 domain-containing protein, partial [Bacteroidota bacterium]